MGKLTVYTRSLLQIALIALLLWFLFTVRSVLIYLIISFVLTLVLKPLFRLFRKIKIKRFQVGTNLATFMSIVVFLSVIVLFNLLFIPHIINEMKFFSQINYRNAFDAIEDSFSELTTYLNNLNIPFEYDSQNLKETILNVLNFNRLKDALESIVGGLGNLAIAVFSVTFMLFFILREEQLGNRISVLLAPDKLKSNIDNIIPTIKTTLTRYFLGLLLQVVAVGSIVYFGLTIVGLKNAVLIAIFAALINLVPYVGPMIGGAFGLLLGMGQAFATGYEGNLIFLALQIIIVFAVMQVTDNSLLQPLIYSKSIKAHPLEIFIVISFAGVLGGIGAMIIAIPFYSVFRIFIWEFFPNFPLIKHLKKE